MIYMKAILPDNYRKTEKLNGKTILTNCIKKKAMRIPNV